VRDIGNSAGSRIVTLAALLVAARIASAAEDAAAERAAFGEVVGEITLDGKLDETSWRAATPVAKFFETYPAHLGNPAVVTTVAFLHDDRNVYVAIRAQDDDPADIRASFVRRDQVLADQDYVEVLLDPMNTRRSALFFRVNARGVLTDGQYEDKNRNRDYSPDLNFDAATSIDEHGWTVEIKIPLASLRYRAGVENSWAYVVYRNLPRQQVVTLSSAPIPRGETCELCYASILDGVAVEKRGALSVIPHVAYERLDGNSRTSGEFGAGIDLTWKPRENTVVDATIFPDFSQIEADAPQLTANTQFALALIEKRPFFLEGMDLLTTQIPAIYTRAFTDPDIGVRITDRSARHEYTALALRDAGGGTVIEPGPTGSRLALQDFESTGLVVRNRLLFDDTSFGLLASGRFNDDGSQNVVFGADGTWMPSAANQVTAQFVTSQTRNPNRPDLLDAWTGQALSGSATSLMWTHSSSDWYGSLSHQSYSRDFRAWNGFVTQVGISSTAAIVSRYFYPGGGLVTRFGPQLTATRIEGNVGGRINQAISPGFVIRAARDTMVSFAWQPNTETMTLAGLRTYDSFRLAVSATPFPWMPQAILSVTGGKMPDTVTGAIGDGWSIQGTIPLRFAQFEIGSTLGHQSLQATGADGPKTTLFTERNLQVSATWHFSGRLNLRFTHQEATFDAVPPFAGLEARVHARSRLSSLLLRYQTNWQTRFYLGVSQTSEQEQIFAKISYAFSN
jgi:hypothetical protein